MKTYFSVLLRNTIDVNTIFRNELIFFSNLKNLKSESNSLNNSFYLLKLFNNLIRDFVIHQPFFSFPSCQQLIYLTSYRCENRRGIDNSFK